ncbi:DoxX family protein [Fuerstiella marisgermanici]|uniref:Inner membrane protein YphA n=1 Tax=Fuerstiella marisgermanici TaxID=1891926 RepID=A0A1P8W9N1_9PLAN|nr:DoxX family protein [Fuerstiella marisgermanici]APZ90760.1 Inner membrane protein YphA [Fuerstiella marisgermanici]
MTDSLQITSDSTGNVEKNAAARPSLAIGLLILRVSMGGLMLVHGVPKLMGFSKMSGKFPDPLGMGSQLSLISAIGAEVGCALLVIVGLGTRVAAIPLAFTMFVALFIVHGADPWKMRELAAVYLCGYLALIFTGPGCFSLDQLIVSKRQQS